MDNIDNKLGALKDKDGRCIRKNLKISLEPHKILLEYCEKNNLNMRKFIDSLIINNCKL